MSSTTRIHLKTQAFDVPDDANLLFEGADSNDKRILGIDFKKAIPVKRGKAVFVDLTLGNDTTGLRERMDRPYQSLAAAQAVAVSGDTIYVFQGTYSVNANLYKSGVIWYFNPGTTVDFNGAAAGYMFDDGNVAGSLTIQGYGSFSYNGSNGAGGLVKTQHGNTTVLLEGTNFTGTTSSPLFQIGATGSAGICYYTVNRIQNLGTGDAMVSSGAASTHILNYTTVVLGGTGTNSVALRVQGGSAVFYITGSPLYPDSFYGTKYGIFVESTATLARIHINNCNVTGATTAGIRLDPANAYLFALNSRIIGAIGIFFSGSTGSIHILKNVDIGAGTNSLDGSASTNVRLFGMLTTNLTKTGFIIFTVGAANFIVDVDVFPFS